MPAPDPAVVSTDPLVARLAQILDPAAFDDRTQPHTLGALWDQTCRRMTAQQHAARAIAAGWTPTSQVTP